MKVARIIHKINWLYSVLWIACTGSDKFQYREKSRVHNFLMTVGYEAVLKEKKWR